MSAQISPLSPPYVYPVTWGPVMPPELQQVWEWRVALAYFLMGIGGMGLVLLAATDIRFRRKAAEGKPVYNGYRFAQALTALLSFALAGASLVLAAGKPATVGFAIYYYGLMYGRWESWMFLGAGFLGVSILLALVYSAIWLGPKLGPLSAATKWFFSKSKGADIASYAFIALAIAFGTLSTFYGGILFSQTNISLWKNSMLPLLFPASGLSAAAAMLMILASLIIKDVGEKERTIAFLSTVDLFAVASEAVLLGLYLYIGFVFARAFQSVEELLFGTWAFYFWLLVVTIGIVIPLLLELAMHKVNPRHYIWMVPLVFLLVLIGAFSLRYFAVIAAAYYYPPLSPLSPTQMQFPFGTRWGP